MTKSAAARYHGLEDDLEVIGVGLAVAVRGDDEPGPVIPGDPVAEAQRRTLAPVDGRDAGVVTGRADLRSGAVVLTVDHDEHCHRQAAYLLGHGADDLGDVLALFVGRDHDRDR